MKTKTTHVGQPPRLPCFAEAPSGAEGEAEGLSSKRSEQTTKPAAHRFGCTNPKLASRKFVTKKVLRKDGEIAADPRKNVAYSLP
jgi:hypothetical protein